MIELRKLDDAEIDLVSGGHDTAWDKFWHNVGESIAEGIGNMANGPDADYGSRDDRRPTTGGGGGW